MSDWFKATRTSGDKNKPGEFVVEDSEGAEWQVTAIDSKKKPGTLTLLNEVVCMNKRYECDWVLRGDIQEAVCELLKDEAAECPHKRREAFIADVVALCVKHRVMMEPDGSELDDMDIDDIMLSEFDSSKDITFHVGIGEIEDAIRQAVWPVVHPE
jgi:hypothetical protein